MPKSKEINYKKLYGEILLGYSRIFISGREGFLRHYGPIQQALIDAQYSDFYEYFLNEGIPSEKDKLEQLISEGLWEPVKDTQISKLRGEIDKLKLTKSKLVFEADKAFINGEIENKRKELRTLERERHELVGQTAESFAERKINDCYIIESLFADNKFGRHLMTKEEFDELDSTEMIKVVESFNRAVNDFTDKTIKKISLLNQFQNYLSLSGDDGFNFFRKPIIELTFFQFQLLSYGRNFRGILSSGRKPPSDILEDPDKLMDWYESSQKAEQITQKSNGAAVGLVGASHQESKNLIGAESFGFENMANEKGGKLNKRDIANLFGI